MIANIRVQKGIEHVLFRRLLLLALLLLLFVSCSSPALPLPSRLLCTCCKLSGFPESALAKAVTLEVPSRVAAFHLKMVRMEETDIRPEIRSTEHERACCGWEVCGSGSFAFQDTSAGSLDSSFGITKFDAPARATCKLHNESHAARDFATRVIGKEPTGCAGPLHQCAFTN